MKIATLPKKTAETFIGGYGIGAKVLFEMMKPGADALGPDNIIGFTTGPLTGTGALFSGRYTVVCKSPVTGGWNDANSGGYFGSRIEKKPDTMRFLYPGLLKNLCIYGSTMEKSKLKTHPTFGVKMSLWQKRC